MGQRESLGQVSRIEYGMQIFRRRSVISIISFIGLLLGFPVLNKW